MSFSNRTGPPETPADDHNPYRPPDAELIPTTPSESCYDATRWTRLGGSFIDGLLSFATMIPGFILILATDNETSNLGGIILGVVGVLALSIYQWYLISTTGQSLAKKWLNMKIVKIDGSDVGFVSGVILREWITYCLCMIPYLGNLVVLADAVAIFGAERRCLHDHIAGTRVIVVIDY